MNLPKSLRHLEQAAHDRNARDVEATLGELARNAGWASDVAEFVKRMPARERSFVLSVMGPPPGDPDGTYVGGGSPGSGGAQQPDPTPVVTPTWTVDATSGIAVPVSTAEWSAFIAAKGLSISAPAGLWLCQEASGSLADSIGVASLVAANAPSFQNAVTGWSRKAVGAADASTSKFSSTDASLPDPSATSALVLTYVAVTATPAGVRTLTTFATTNGSESRVTTNPFYRGASGANAATGVAVVNTNVHPVAMKVDHTALAQTNYSDLEKLSPTWATPSGKRLGIGAQGGSSPAALWLYVVMWSGAAAEMSDATVKALLQALGWTIPWT